MNKLILLFLIALTSGCVTPERVAHDYKEAEKNDQRAKEARERGSFEEAKRLEQRAEQQRDHDGLSIVAGIIVSLITSSSQETKD